MVKTLSLKFVKNIAVALLIFYVLVPRTLSAWQDDVDVFLRPPKDSFVGSKGPQLFTNALSQVRGGRYLAADENHRWRAGVGGDITLLRISKAMLWHINLNMETLADDQNDISFRLVQVYYEIMTGLRFMLGPGALNADYRHRCSHGTDNAVASRILIRSGFHVDYLWQLEFNKLHLLFKTELDIFLLGQNSHRESQTRGGPSLSAQVKWPIMPPLALLAAIGYGFDIIGTGTNNLYMIHHRASDIKLGHSLGVRAGVQVDRGGMKSEFSLHIANNLDSGMGNIQTLTSSLSLDINFMW